MKTAPTEHPVLVRETLERLAHDCLDLSSEPIRWSRHLSRPCPECWDALRAQAGDLPLRRALADSEHCLGRSLGRALEALARAAVIARSPVEDRGRPRETLGEDDLLARRAAHQPLAFSHLLLVEGRRQGASGLFDAAHLTWEALEQPWPRGPERRRPVWDLAALSRATLAIAWWRTSSLLPGVFAESLANRRAERLLVAARVFSQDSHDPAVHAALDEARAARAAHRGRWRRALYHLSRAELSLPAGTYPHWRVDLLCRRLDLHRSGVDWCQAPRFPRRSSRCQAPCQTWCQAPRSRRRSALSPANENRRSGDKALCFIRGPPSTDPTCFEPIAWLVCLLGFRRPPGF